MENIDVDTLDEFIDAIYTRIEEKFSKQLNAANVEYAFSGIVTVADNKKKIATVDIGSSTIEDIPNHTGEDLLVDDTVKVFSDKRNMVGAYIGVKLASKTT